MATEHGLFLERIFPGDGEMARLCREYDWTRSPLGPPSEWPQALRTTVAMLLESRHPMLVFWGPELIQIYNDAYRAILGAGERHPAALGARGKDFWASIWEELGPRIERVLTGGEATWQENELIPIERNDRIEDVYWTYSQSPVRGDTGEIEGVLAVCQETTAAVHAEAELRRLSERLTTHLESQTDAYFTLDREWRFTFLNTEALRLLERSREELLGVFIWDAFPDAVGTTSQEMYELAVETGKPVEFEQFFPPLDHWFRARAFPSDAGLAVYFQDISESKAAEGQLHESERQFREFAESMPLVVWSATPQGEVDYTSEAILHYTGRSWEELEGERWLDVVHPDDVESTVAAWSRSVETGEPYETEFRIRRADGSYRWFITRAHPFRSPKGEILRWYGSSMDIHDRLEAERTARELADRLTTTLESITDAFYVLDREWRFSFLNAEAERLLDTARGDLLGRSVWEAFEAARGTRLEAEYRRAVREGVTASFDYFYPPLDAWFEVRAYPSEEGLAVYFRDVSRERAAAERLREQAELLDRAQDAILVRELDHSIVFWNAGAERLYGWPREEALGRSIRELLYADPAAFDEATRSVLEAGEWVGELEHLKRDGTTLTVEGRWSLVRDDEGTPRRILAINTDSTERKKLLAQSLRTQRMESIGTLAGGIAHDLNNVLAPILLAIGTLQLDIDDPEMKETLDTIESSARRGAELVQQVLAFARGVEGAQTSVDLSEVVGDLRSVVRDSFPKGITLRWELGKDLRAVRGDSTQVQQVLLNLLVNARDAMPEGGVLRVTAENVTIDEHFAEVTDGATPGAYVRVSVEDSGRGMPPEVVQQIFDPFFTTKEVGEGTGLGLSTVAAIMRSHGGFTTVYSEVGTGSIFHLHFPAVTLERAKAKDRRQRAARPSAPRGRGELILVVDDENSVREITRRTLEAFGYRVITATDGADAVTVYRRRRDDIALVLTDIMMPIMDGPAAIRTLTGMNPSVRIVAASGMGGADRVASAAEFGVKHFLPKPYTSETLLTTIHEALHGDD